MPRLRRPGDRIVSRCPLLSGRPNMLNQCLLLGVKRMPGRHMRGARVHHVSWRRSTRVARKTSTSRVFASVLIVLTIGAATAACSQDKTITVFAGTSLKDALDDVDAAFTKQTGVKVVAARYDASSALMKQIEGGAPADAFLSADLHWMDYGVEKKFINESTRFDLLGNVLVLIAGRDSKIDHVDIKPGFDLAKLAGGGRIATGDVNAAVPVGLYAKAALEKLGVWSSVEPKMMMASNVRAALAYVARKEATLGIVYATDANVGGVKV